MAHCIQISGGEFLLQYYDCTILNYHAALYYTVTRILTWSKHCSTSTILRGSITLLPRVRWYYYSLGRGFLEVNDLFRKWMEDFDSAYFSISSFQCLRMASSTIFFQASLLVVGSITSMRWGSLYICRMVWIFITQLLVLDLWSFIAICLKMMSKSVELRARDGIIVSLLLCMCASMGRALLRR